MGRIDMLAFKFDSYDTDAFVKNVISYSENSVILVFDFDKITVRHAPLHAGIAAGSTIKFFRTRDRVLNHYIAPLLVSADTLITVRLFVGLCVRCRPKVCWAESPYAAVILGILRRCFLAGKLVYIPGDWLAGPGKKSAASYVWSDLLFPFFDLFACRLSDLVLNHTEQIAGARRRFWGRKIARNEKPYIYKMQACVKPDRAKGRDICFMGVVRDDSGLDIVVRSLASLGKSRDVKLKIIGPQNYRTKDLVGLAASCGAPGSVEVHGFIEGRELEGLLSGCFCGVNLLTSAKSYSFYTIPGKMVHYLQHLLPVVTTEGAGFMASVIRENRLGLVIEPSQSAFAGAASEIFNNYEKYRDNIAEYIERLPGKTIKEMLEA